MATPTSTPTPPPEHPLSPAAARAAPRARPLAAELLPWALLVLGALVLRLLDLGDRVYHHDESQVAYFSKQLHDDPSSYVYNPLLHGPWQYYATALTYAIAGISDFTARLAPALMGTVLVALPFFARERLGRPAALTAAALLAISPTALYYSRFAREDIHIAVFALAMLIVAARWLVRPRPWHPIALLALLALSFTVKESTLIWGFVVFLFLLGYAAVLVVRGTQGRAEGLRALRATPWWAWPAGLVAFVVVQGLFFSSFLHNPGELLKGIYDGASYWLDQHQVRRGGEPAGFYVAILGLHELPIVALGAVGLVDVARRRDLVGAFCAWLFAGSLAVYSWAGEKFAWLVLHPLVPLALLAGFGVQALWRARARAAGRVGLLLAALAFAGLAASSWSVNARDPIDPAEFLVTTQSAGDVKGVRDEILALVDKRRRAGAAPPTVLIDPNDGGSFPWAWYLRDITVDFNGRVREPSFVPTADVMVLTDGTQQLLAPKLADYDGRRFHFRVWWVRDFSKLRPRSLWRWYVHREPWNPTGGMDAWVYVRRTS